jgi:phosphonoacetaldehyde hydrolase
MGQHKRDHIANMLADPAIAERWRAAHGQAPDTAAADRLFAAFAPRQREVLAAHCDLIPGLTDAIATLRARGIGIGSTTGYTTDMMTVVTPRAAEQGYAPDVVVHVDEVVRGRPAPFMAHTALQRLDAMPVTAAVAVGDTVSDIEAGLNAGMWTVATVLSGNEVGLAPDALAALSVSERATRVATARDRLARAGAHELVDTVADLSAAVARIEARLAQGETP